MSTNASVVATFRKIFSVIPKDQRKRAFGVLVAMFLASLVQVAGVASVMPFLLVLTEPDLITANPAFNRIYEGLDFETSQSFQIALGMLTFVILLLSAALRSFAFYAQHVFAQDQRVALSARIMRGYLAQPYRFFVRSVQAELAKTLTQETSQFVDRALVPAATVVNAVLQLATLLLLLVVLDPVVTLVMTLVLGSTYVAAYRLTRPHLTRYGEARLSAELDSIRAVWETLSGIKAIKLAGTEDTFLNRYRTPAQTVGRAMAMVALMQTLPRYAIEAVAFGCIVLLAMVLTLNSGNVGGSVLPMLAIYAFAGYRMMPALQQIYNGLASIRFVTSNIQAISARLVELEKTPPLLAVPAPLPVRETIELDDVSYHHNTDEGRGIDGVSLTLKAGQSLGIVGPSGAGKTTLIDVILGLMTPDGGRLLVDGTPIDDSNRRAWQQSLGYVPQDIFLATRSVAENIAFGYESEQIYHSRVEICARIAQIHDTVTQDLPDGYDTQIGDRGLRLSGGQRQRLGIARALYRDPAVLVFDEATNALDPITEARVTEALTLHCAGKTRIVIAHRLSSVASCDLIAVMQDGRLTDLGSYEQLCARSEIFQALRRAEAKVEPTP